MKQWNEKHSLQILDDNDRLDSHTEYLLLIYHARYRCKLACVYSIRNHAMIYCPDFYSAVLRAKQMAAVGVWQGRRRFEQLCLSRSAYILA